MKKVLTIAGSDCSGGAGIQADIKTMLMNDVYAMSVITALTAQNTVGVQAILDIDYKMVEAQLDSVFSDIYPDAIKIGMVSNSKIIESIANKLSFYKAKNIVVDPVMVATSKGKLIAEEAVNTLSEKLFPLCSLITPNLFEAEVLSSIKINNRLDMEKAGKILFEKYGCSVLVKGGHLESSAADYLICDKNERWFDAPLIDNKNTHGTGCTLSSAIASCLAKGYLIDESVEIAKKYLTKLINYKLDIGNGRGPLNHKI